ncbi:MAG: helix-turn-helix transcriptional regulator [Ruminococcus sp.]|nr:helix-turn-helix transcriptional regulator [Ruminococcus sp.]
MEKKVLRCSPNQRFLTDKIKYLQTNNDDNIYKQLNEPPPEEIGHKMISSRYINGLSAKDIALILQSSNTTISRYENGHFTFEHANLELLKKYAVACGNNPYFFFNEYMIFREFKKQILEQFEEHNKISKTKLAQQLGVSKKLVLTWFNKKERSPSHEMWQTAFKDITLMWIKENADILEDKLRS